MHTWTQLKKGRHSGVITLGRSHYRLRTPQAHNTTIVDLPVDTVCVISPCPGTLLYIAQETHPIRQWNPAPQPPLQPSLPVLTVYMPHGEVIGSEYHMNNLYKWETRHMKFDFYIILIQLC